MTDIPSSRLAAYTGRPYAWGGRGPGAYDCWGLVRAIYADIMGVDLPPGPDGDYPDAADAAGIARGFLAGAQSWRAIVNRPTLRAPLEVLGPVRTGDVALIRMGRWPVHVGIVVTDPRWGLDPARWRLLEIAEGYDSAVVPLLRQYPHQLMGVYRLF